MTEFEDRVKEDTPRLVIKYKCIEGKDFYDWGIIGEIPILSIIGFMCRLQMELHSSSIIGSDSSHDCPEEALVVIWDSKFNSFDWFVHENIPTDSLLGMLETIKTTIVVGRNAQKVVAQQRVILGRDGRPIG